MPASDDRPLAYADFTLDVRTGELRRGDQCVVLQRQPLRILIRLLERPGKLVTREELRYELWGDDTFVDFEHGLNAAIKRLREALGDSAESPRFIETLPRRGYRLVTDRNAKAADLAEPVQPAPGGPGAEQAGGTSRARMHLRTLAVAFLALAAVLAVLNLRRMRDWLIGSSPPVRSIAVLPFINQTNDAAQDYLVDGIHEAVLTDLARVGPIRVVSRTSVIRYRNTRKSGAEIGRELDVDAFVEGTCTRTAERVRVTVRLVGVKRDLLLWAGRYERPIAQIMALSNEIAQDVAAHVGASTDQPDRTAHRIAYAAVDPAVLDAYLKGRYLGTRFLIRRQSQMLASFDEAIRLDPNFAPAYAARAFFYAYAGRTELMPPALAFANARVDAERALRLDSTLEEARAALALSRLYRDWDWDGSGLELRRALASNPNDPWLYLLYADYLLVLNRPDEALAYARRGWEVDPFSATARAAVGDALSAAGRFGEAIGECRKALDLEPDSMPAISCLEDALWWNGEREAAIRRVMQRLPTASALRSAMEAALTSGGPAGAMRAMVDFFAAASAEGRGREPFNMARFYAALNDADRAFMWLECAFRERAPLLLQLRWNPDFAALRHDPRYLDLVRRIGFPQ